MNNTDKFLSISMIYRIRTNYCKMRVSGHNRLVSTTTGVVGQSGKEQKKALLHLTLFIEIKLQL